MRLVWTTDHTGDEEDAGMLAFERTGGDAGDEYALIVINTHPSKDSRLADGDSRATVSIAAGTTLTDVLGPEQRTVTVGADGSVELQLAPLTGVVLVP